MSAFFAKAIKLYKEKKYLKVLAEISKMDKKERIKENILLLTGNCYDSLGKKEIAKKFYKKAYRKNNKSEAALLNIAIIYYEEKKYILSRLYIKKLLTINPKNSDALTILGNIYKEKKCYNKAIKFYQKSLNFEKKSYIANMNLADIYCQQKEYLMAYDYAKRAVEVKATAETIKLFAEISIAISQPNEAIFYLEKISEDGNSDCWGYNLLSQLYMQQQEYEKSIKAGFKAIELSKEKNAHHINFGYILYDAILAGQNKLVQKYALAWSKKYPENSIVQYMADSVIHNKKISQHNPVYIREIFNAFADDFENILAHLNYNVPKIMAAELSSFFKITKLKKMRILDAGCGTGLCGYYLKKYAKFNGLDGVDISEKMLSVAKEKKVYSHLYNQDLDSFLQQHKNRYNLINAADVFTYFGDLKKLFQHINISLCAGGRIIFSISENNINNDNYYHHSSGRFLHSEKYVENILESDGFNIEKKVYAHLRNEGEKEVFGWIFIAKKQNKKTS